MKRTAFLLPLVGFAFAPVVWAQPSPTPKTSNDPAIEQVIVTAPRFHVGVTPDAVAHDFIKSFAMPSILTEQISRWEVGVCPVFDGIAPQFAAVTDTHFRTIAAEAGAPLKDKGCKPNLMVLFTSLPQAQLELVHAKNPNFLGYQGATTVTHPIQAWYATAVRDVRGEVFLDHEAFFELDPFSPTKISPTSTAPTPAVGGWRYRPDISSDLLYVTIIVDSAKTAHYQVGEIADYVAMLALSRSEDYGDCQLMPSITNLLSPNCDDKLKPDAITLSDIAYLRGVYKMDPGAKLIIQQDQIASEMAKTLAAGK